MSIAPKTEKKQADLDNGWKAHGIIQHSMPEFRSEEVRTFSSDELDFDIGYHPDLYSPERSILYEIKPTNFLMRYWEFCIAQISGYAHFTKAHLVCFLVYQGKTTSFEELHVHPFMPPYLYPWSYLREIAIKSDAILLEKEREAQS